MSTAMSNVCCFVIGLPGAIWRTVQNFFGNSLEKWWHSHYR
jgi:hypothetical protein